MLRSVLQENALTGEISSLIGLLTSMLEMTLSNNRLSGTFGEIIRGYPGGYRYLEIDGNNLSGTIGKQICPSTTANNQKLNFVRTLNLGLSVLDWGS